MDDTLLTAAPPLSPSLLTSPDVASPVLSDESRAAGNMADELVAVLAHLDVKAVFGVPGGAIEPLYDALARSERRGGPRGITTRHEAGALAMAEGYFRATGRIAACCSTTGPGATNFLTNAAGALVENIPTLILTAQTSVEKFGRLPLQDSSCAGTDVVAMFKHVTKYSSAVTHPAQLVPKLAKALALAHEHPRGPVHLALPSDVLRMARTTQGGPPNLGLLLNDADTDLLSAAGLRAMLERLGDAERPLLLLGERSEVAREEVLELVAHLQLPVAATFVGKRWFPTTHPRFVGIHGFAGHASAEEAVASADLVIAVGSALSELCTNGYSPELLGAKLVHLSESAAGRAAAPWAGLHVGASPKAMLAALNKRVKERWPAPASDCWWTASFQQPPAGEARGQLTPPQVVDFLGRKAAPATTVFADNGNCLSWSIHYMPLNERLSRLHLSMSYGAMTWAIGTSLGASFGNLMHKAPEDQTPVLCMTGDGAWLMSALELTVAVQHRLPIVFVIFNDSELGMVRHGQQLAAAERMGSKLPQVDFASIARACGAKGIRVESAEQLESLDLEALQAEHGPVVLDVVVDGAFVPPMMARMRSLGTAGDNVDSSAA